MQKSFLKLFAAVVVVTSLLTSVPAAFAQSITTSVFNGTVLTEQGVAVAGAPVVVTHEPTGSTYNATTRADGTFAIRGLRPGGPYTATVTASGYAPSVSSEIFLEIDLGASVTIRVRTDDVVVLEKFSVTATAIDQLFDSSQTGSGTYHDERALRNLPTGDRSINSLARLDPRISYNRDPNDRAISANGMSNRYNSIQVDGVSASDPFGLNANNTAAERNVIPLDALEALSINTSPYYSRNAGFVGAQINAITKSGSNDFHGSLYYTYRGRSVAGYDLVGTTLNGIPAPLSNFSEETMGITLGGPIIPKKLFFYLAYEEVNEDRIAPFPSVRLPDATITQIKNAATQLGFETGSENPPSGNKLNDENILAKVDWQINSNHRATFRYNNVESSRPTYPGFGTGIQENNFSFDSHWYDQSVKNTSYIGQLISRWSDKLNTELSISRSKYHSEPMNNSRQPQVQVQNIPVPGSSNTAFVTFGTERSRHANILDVQTDSLELFGSYELSSKHTLQLGVQYEVADIYNLFIQDALGNYTFLTLQEFLNVAATNNGTLRFRQYAYNDMLPGAAAEFGESNTGLFINDKWQVTPNLAVDAGARVDIAGLPDAVPFNQDFLTAFGVRNDYSYDGDYVVQPRIGFNWQPKFGEQRTVIRGGVGLFYGRAPRVWISNSYSNTGSNARNYTAGHNISNPATPIVIQGTVPPPVSADPDNQPITSSTPPRQLVAFMDPDFELPSRWKANLALERELGFWDLKFTAEVEKTWVKQDVFYTNAQLVNTGTGPDGRALFFNAYTGTSASGTRIVSDLFVNGNGQRIIRLGNTDKGGTTSISFSLERPRKKDGWYWKAAYVKTDATEAFFGTSSVATSNWQNSVAFNANTPEEHRSELEVRDRIIFNVTKDLELIKNYPTTFSVFYEGRSGYPFSLIYTGDTNGDSQTQNDLIYVPLRNGDPGVRFATATDQTNFFKIVDRFGLIEGQAVSANNNRYPWVNQFDFGVKQEVKLPGWRHKLVLGLDILNVGNLLNDKWGLIRGSNQFFLKREGVVAATYDPTAKQYVYSNVNAALANGTYTTSANNVLYTGEGFAPSTGRGEPAATRWSILLTARYEF